MNPIDHRLERLLEAARLGCPPVPEPSPWFEQRLVQVLRNDTDFLSSFPDGILLLRILTVAAVVALVSVILPLAQTDDPYREGLDLTNSSLQLEQMR